MEFPEVDLKFLLKNITSKHGALNFVKQIRATHISKHAGLAEANQCELGLFRYQTVQMLKQCRRY
jgi:hypothetical protein